MTSRAENFKGSGESGEMLGCATTPSPKFVEQYDLAVAVQHVTDGQGSVEWGSRHGEHASFSR